MRDITLHAILHTQHSCLEEFVLGVVSYGFMATTYIKNGRVILGDQIVDNTTIEINDGRISAISKRRSFQVATEIASFCLYPYPYQSVTSLPYPILLNVSQHPKNIKITTFGGGFGGGFSGEGG